MLVILRGTGLKIFIEYAYNNSGLEKFLFCLA